MSEEIIDKPLRIEDDNNIKGKIIINDHSQNYFINANGMQDQNKNRLGNNLISNVISIAKNSKTLVAAAPVLLPIATKIVKKLSNTQQDALRLNQQTKQYYLENINQKGYYMINYNNPEGNTPLTDYIRTFKSNLEIDDEFEFTECNKFTKYFSKFLKKKTNKVEYTESKKQNSGKFEIAYHFTMQDKIFKIKIVSMTYSKESSETKEGNRLRTEYSSDKLEIKK